ncbi:MAG: signal peptide peptidase SppA, partial [Xanthomonadales bacterium]|nr:signal peptide peptidase SppA [Xanthomonadales bacterium]
YAAYRNYYAEGLDKLAVEVNLFRAGEYKSAMEPFVRNDMSEEAREANLYWLGSLWQQYLEGVSRARGVPLETLADTIEHLPERVDEAGGNLAQLALELGLVDRLAGQPEMRQELSLRGVSVDQEGRLNEIDFRDYLSVRPLRRLPGPGPSVAVVVAEGDILQGQQPAGTVGADTLAERLYQAGATDGVQAVVLRVDSPGGDAFASEIVRRELQSLRDGGKTVVVSMGDVAASGGYWIGLAADEIWASAATVTGSIGVYGMVPTFNESLQKLGIHTDGVGTTPLAGRLRLDLPMDEGLRRIFQSTTEETYQRFLALVANARGLTTEEVHEIARGRVWTGQQAADRGLVDRVGTLADAVDSAARIAGLGDDYGVRWIEPELTGFERFMLNLTGDSRVRINAKLPGQDVAHLPLVQRLLGDLRTLMQPGQAFSVAAHCLCGVE